MDDQDIIRKIEFASGMGQQHLQVIERTEDKCTVEVHYHNYILTPAMAQQLVDDAEDIIRAKADKSGYGINYIYIDFEKTINHSKKEYNLNELLIED